MPPRQLSKNTMHKNKTVYVAGPYTKPDPCANTHRAAAIAGELIEHGFIPFIPHLTHFWHTMHPRPYEFWLDYEMVWLRKCDCVLRFDGESSGADKEVIEAERLGIPVYFSVESLVEAMA